MAIAPEIPVPLDVPTGAAVASFTIDRLGAVPSLRVTIAETVEDVAVWTVAGMVESEASTEEAPAYSGVAVTVTAQTGFPTAIVGAVLLAADDTALGTVTAVGQDTILLDADLTVDLTDAVVRARRSNPMGVPALRRAQAVPARELVLQMVDGAQIYRMAALMITAHVKAVLAVLPALSADSTLEEVQAAVLASPDNLESILATEFEALEMERRAGEFVGHVVTVV